MLRSHPLCNRLIKASTIYTGRNYSIVASRDWSTRLTHAAHAWVVLTNDPLTANLCQLHACTVAPKVRKPKLITAAAMIPESKKPPHTATSKRRRSACAERRSCCI